MAYQLSNTFGQSISYANMNVDLVHHMYIYTWAFQALAICDLGRTRIDYVQKPSLGKILRGPERSKTCI